MILSAMCALCAVFCFYATIQMYRVEKEVAWEFIGGTVLCTIGTALFAGSF